LADQLMDVIDKASGWILLDWTTATGISVANVRLPVDMQPPPYFRRQTNTGLPRRMSYFRPPYGLPLTGVNATGREF
jgi:hypothetical protein